MYSKCFLLSLIVPINLVVNPKNTEDTAYFLKIYFFNFFSCFLFNVNLAVREGFPDRIRVEIQKLSQHIKTHPLWNHHNPNAEQTCSSQAAGPREAWTDGLRAKKDRSLLGGTPSK